MLGLASPDNPDGMDTPITNTGDLAASPTPEPDQGFLPIQVEVGGKPEEAPALPPTPTPFQPVRPTATLTAPALAIPAVSNNPQTAVSAPAPTVTPTATPEQPAPPGWISIPKIGLDAPVIVSHTRMVEVNGQAFAQWEAPNMYAAGWQEGSAMLGERGNTVLNGHHNIYGEVFGRLYELEQGDQITVYSGDRAFNYAVAQVMKLEERNMPLAQREENARWVMPSTDERLTLVTCWPPYTNTYRLIVVAVPVK
jgi:sortase A